MRQFLAELDEADYAILAGMAAAASVPRVRVMRWAIRFYAMRGPWAKGNDERIELIGADQIEVGPRRERI